MEDLAALGSIDPDLSGAQLVYDQKIIIRTFLSLNSVKEIPKTVPVISSSTDDSGPGMYGNIRSRSALPASSGYSCNKLIWKSWKSEKKMKLANKEKHIVKTIVDSFTFV